jgi:prevent-host-death family protein
MCYAWSVKRIAQRELRNHSGEILREAEKGARFLITVEGRPIAMLSPYPKRQWVPKAEIVKLLRTGKTDPSFFEDVAELGALNDLTDRWER